MTEATPSGSDGTDAASALKYRSNGRRKSNAAFIVIVVVLIGALGVEGFILTRPKPKVDRPQEAQRAIAAASNNIETFGEKSAPTKIEFYAPLTLQWHQKTIGLLREYDKAHPGTIFVTLMPMGNSDCDSEMLKHGHKCAAILVNGKNEFTLPGGKTVTLQQRPNADGSTYNSEDVITIVEGMAKGK